MKKLFFILVVSLLTSLSALAQAAVQPASTPPIDDDVVKITTSLIQLDVVVTDKNGNLITDLKPEDFEITENGEQQTVTNLSYFSGQKLRATDGSLTMTTGAAAKTVNLQSAAAPTAGEVRRTVAIVVDDAGLTPQTLPPVKKDLIKFINEQMQPGDLVAIIRTSSSVGILQQFTTDKNRLRRVVEDLQIRPANNPEGLSALGTIGISFAEQISTISSGGGLSDKGKTSVFQQKNSVESFADINRNLQVTSGALGVLNASIGAMSALPGRKSVLYVAHGVDSIFNYNNTNMSSDKTVPTNVALIFSDIDKLRDKLRGITEFANRAAISIFSYDPRGAQPVSLSADVATRGGMFDSMTSAQVDNKLSTTSNTFRNSQQGLKFLAEETGGKAYINTNDFGKSLRDTLESQNGYYIIGYQPDTDSFDANTRRFNKLAVRVKRPGVNVSYRSGFFNIAETSDEPKAATDARFTQKIFSPYSYNEINVKATSIFAADEQTATVRTFIGIKPEDLQFTANADDTKTALFDVVAVAFNADGIATAQIAKRFEIKAAPKDYEELAARGITYNLTFAARTKGVQQIKIAVRDANSNRTGTIMQTVDVPDFGKSALNLSGLLLQNYTMQEWQTLQSGASNKAAPPITPAEAASRMQSDTAQRRFKKGTVLSFNYAIYAASLSSKSQAQFAVFKDGKELFKGAAEELNIAATGKMQRVNRGGAFLLGTDMAAGKYVLQITVGGDAVKESQIQQIDFELVN